MSHGSVPLWRQIQRGNFTKLDSLLDFLMLSQENREKVWNSPRFACNVPRRLAEKMAKNSLDDPLFRQFVPLAEEQTISSGFALDPVQDKTFCKTGKMLQKYQGRALLLTTSACAMHCRFCFRQNFPYETEVQGFETEIEMLKQDPSIHEVILSGGDPLSLSNRSLEALFDALCQIPHLRRVRFHTRFLLGIPERMDDSLLEILSKAKQRIFFVIHCNHPDELDEDVIFCLQRILALKIPVLNQSVLLRGVNERPEVMLRLCESLINHGILPYYLHQLDPVQGAAHFWVSDEQALSLIRFLQENLSGFAVPRLVREEPGRLHKTPILGSILSLDPQS